MTKVKDEAPLDRKMFLAAARAVLLSRRQLHPSGTFDSGGRWYPDSDEVQNCCNCIRTPSRAYPYSLLTHCRSIKHVARTCDVPEKELRRVVRKSLNYLQDACFYRYVLGNPQITTVGVSEYLKFKLLEESRE